MVHGSNIYWVAPRPGIVAKKLTGWSTYQPDQASFMPKTSAPERISKLTGHTLVARLFCLSGRQSALLFNEPAPHVSFF
jgi:hypothetical protein